MRSSTTPRPCSGPAHAVGVVDIHPEIGMLIEQPSDGVHRSNVTEHRVDAVCQVPDLVVVPAGVDHRSFERCLVVVWERSHVDAGRFHDLGCEVDR